MCLSGVSAGGRCGAEGGSRISLQEGVDAVFFSSPQSAPGAPQRGTSANCRKRLMCIALRSSRALEGKAGGSYLRGTRGELAGNSLEAQIGWIWGVLRPPDPGIGRARLVPFPG